jgi:hypothetical protein
MEYVPFRLANFNFFFLAGVSSHLPVLAYTAKACSNTSKTDAKQFSALMLVCCTSSRMHRKPLFSASFDPTKMLRPNSGALFADAVVCANRSVTSVPATLAMHN